MVSALGLGNPNAAVGPKTICHKIGEILIEPRRKVRLGDTLRDVMGGRTEGLLSPKPNTAKLCTPMKPA